MKKSFSSFVCMAENAEVVTGASVAANDVAEGKVREDIPPAQAAAANCQPSMTTDQLLVSLAGQVFQLNNQVNALKANAVVREETWSSVAKGGVKVLVGTGLVVAGAVVFIKLVSPRVTVVKPIVEATPVTPEMMHNQ